MDEKRLNQALSGIYHACQMLELIIEDLEQSDNPDDMLQDYLQETYDTLFDMTTEIEEHFNMI